MSDRRWSAADFDFALPPELIAQVPTPVRGASRMLVVDRAKSQTEFRDDFFSSLVNIIPPNDMLIVNSTKVRHARLLGMRPSGAPAEVLLIHPSIEGSWIAMGSPGRAMQPGKQITLGEGVAIETLEVLDNGMRRVRFVGATAADAMQRFGQIPLPPYIERTPTADDSDRYQTVYAEREGSVAAPTAGLHFTDELLAALRARGVTVGSLDLEVGPGTFRPMDDGDVTAHPMHSEDFEVGEALAAQIDACRAGGGKIWAVGTTVVRALESAATENGGVRAGRSSTALLIMPGFQFQVVDNLLTNFHLPRSTLLMLVAAFAGYERMMAAYQHAVRERYRFYSYGDAMCITTSTEGGAR